MNFNKRLSAILEDGVPSRMHPALIITVRGREIKADHARWMKGRNDRIFLAVGIGPGMFEHTSSDGIQRTMSRARDFFAPPRWIRLDSFGNPTDWEEAECGECGTPPNEHSPTCSGYVPGHYDAHSDMILRRRFQHILSIHKENVQSIKWL